MISLNTHLSTIGISSAKGIDLVMQRDQIKSTLPRSNGTSSQDVQPADTSKKRVAGNNELTPEQQRQVEELKQIDSKVHQHEQAHLAAGRDLITSGPNYTYTYGPDGKRYATGGEVGIDTAAEKQPEANIDKGQRIQTAALAPSEPSPQDYRVASLGSQLETQGHSELVRQQQEERIAQEEAARQKREALTPASDTVAAPAHAPSHQASVEGNQASGRNSQETRTLVQNAYATATAGPANAGRVSEFA